MGLEELVGLGVTIALTDMFSEGAESLVSKLEEVEHAAGGTAHAVKEAAEGIKAGIAMMGAGAAILAPLIMIGDKSVEAAERAERLKMTFESLAPDSEDLYDNVKGIGQELRLFPNGQVLDAGKQMAAMGINAERIPDMLYSAGVAATVMGDSIEGVANKMQMLSMMADNHMLNRRMLTSLGVRTSDLIAEGIKMNGGKLISSSEALMNAVQHVMETRMGPAAEKLREGLPGLEQDIARQFGKFYRNAGESGLVELKTSIVSGFYDILKSLDLEELGKSFGAGLSTLYEILAPIGRLFKNAAVALGEFLAAHPSIVRFATALAGLVGVGLIVVGAMITLGSVVRILPVVFKLFEEQAVASLSALWGSLAPVLPELLLLAAAAGVIYAAWTSDFGGLRSTITRWYDSIASVIEGVVELFTSDEEGRVGSISKALHDKLVENGLWGVTKVIFLWGERVKELFVGVWEGVTGSIGQLAPIFGVIWQVVSDVVDVFGMLLSAIGLSNDSFGGLNDTTQTSLDLMKFLGEWIGVAAVAFAAIRTATLAYGVAQKIVAAGQWAWNAALGVTDALLSPILLVFIAIGAAIGIVIAYWDKLVAAFKSALGIKPIRWLMSKFGGAKDASAANVDDAMGSREREGSEKQRRRQALGRDDFFSRISDNTSFGMDLDAAGPYAPAHPGEGSSPVASRSSSFDMSQVVQAIREGMASGQPQPLQVYLDGELIHSSVVRKEANLADRRGDF